MAKPEHLAKLREGKAAWNTWRLTTNFRVDLTDADLRAANLVEFDLRATDFMRADLRGADLKHAHCLWTDFSGADLRDSNVTFLRTFGTRFEGTNFSGAAVGYSSFADSSLRGAVLTNIRHDAPSSVGLDTFFNSGGLPEEFLRGCGVPESFITYANSLLGNPIEYYSCFISYSSKDDEFARRLHEGLQAKNIRTWFAPEDLKIGDRFRSRIDESIRIHDKLVLILSEHSINSAWVQREVETALEREDKEKRDLLFPIRLDDSVFASNAAWARDVCRRHIGDFRNWKNHDDYTKAFDRLVKDLKKEGPVIMSA